MRRQAIGRTIEKDGDERAVHSVMGMPSFRESRVSVCSRGAKLDLGRWFNQEYHFITCPRSGWISNCADVE